MSEPKKSRSRGGWLIVLILSLLLLVGGCTAYVLTHPWWKDDIDPEDYRAQTTAATQAPVPSLPTVPATEPNPPETTDSPEDLADNPVDFAALQAVNPDAYAWLLVPLGGEGKDIDLPVLQSRLEDDDNFYLHNDIHRSYRYAGCLYTQKANAKDFSDRVTVIYGHNMLDGTMFSNLVFFRDDQFFREHEFFYLYTPGHILTYRIASAIQFDTRHILNCFDFSKDSVFQDWIQNYILEPKSMIRAVREGIEVTTDDKLVILSTCMDIGGVRYRYLIQGVLIQDEPTK